MKTMQTCFSDNSPTSDDVTLRIYALSVTGLGEAKTKMTKLLKDNVVTKKIPWSSHSDKQVQILTSIT